MIEELLKMQGCEKIKAQRCKRLGIKIKHFSNVLGIILIEGILHYDANKNTRSNAELQIYKDANVLNKRVLVYIVQDQDYESVYNNFGDNADERELNLRRLMKVYENFGPYDNVIYGKGAPGFKFARSKTFFIKLKKGIYRDLHTDTNVFVHNITIECDSII